MTARARARGFTLVELMVSLVAGLIVTIAVVGLARTATTTFYEEARLSTTEATVRSAAERLRQDLSRVSYMSTGNIKLARNDSPSVPFGQKISHIPGAATPSRYGALTDNLSGIRITVGGSQAAAQGPNNLSTVNGLNPDSIELTGNFTTDDSYRGKMNGSNSIVLDVGKDPAVARLIAGPDPDKAVRNAFTPGSQSGTIPPFLARVVDPRGCLHFVVISNAVATATTVTLSFAAAVTGNPVLLPTEDESTCGANDQEEVSINPIQTVRWYIGATNTALAPDPSVNQVGNKFDLYREIVDASGASIAAPGGPQVVAEYVIDLKFGISVDSPAAALPPPTNQLTFDMDTDGVAIGNWTQAASATSTGNPAPHRVRAVRFRLATRASLPDRDAPLSLLPGQPYISRYCTQAATPCKQFARVRTIMSEATLMNQAGMTY
jgi:Tfp pilus assembly protein PilE/mRNA-degrading endonuclease toxin of MazEF toxin-antitoxin module